MNRAAGAADQDWRGEEDGEGEGDVQEGGRQGEGEDREDEGRGQGRSRHQEDDRGMDTLYLLYIGHLDSEAVHVHVP